MSQPPYPWPSPYAPPPPPPPTPRRLTRAQQLAIILGLSIGGALVLFACTIAALAAIAPRPTTTIVIHATPTATHPPQAAATATARPQPTATPTASPGLGSLASAFNATYPLQSATEAGISATFTGSSDTGTDGQPHITSLTFTFGDPPSDDQAGQFLTHFFPADAQHIADPATDHGTYHVYRSAALASTFTPDAFVTEAGDPASPGTFSWSHISPTTIFLALGTN